MFSVNAIYPARYNKGMEKKENARGGDRPTPRLPSLDGYSLAAGDLVRVSRRIGDGEWAEYSVSFGELVTAIRRELSPKARRGA